MFLLFGVLFYVMMRYGCGTMEDTAAKLAKKVTGAMRNTAATAVTGRKPPIRFAAWR